MDITTPWNLLRLACCRCGAQRVINRETLARYDREVFLCLKCEEEPETGYCGRCDDDEATLCEHELCGTCCGCGGEPA